MICENKLMEIHFYKRKLIAEVILHNEPIIRDL